jgi:hypothetical protein
MVLLSRINFSASARKMRRRTPSLITGIAPLSMPGRMSFGSTPSISQTAFGAAANIGSGALRFQRPTATSFELAGRNAMSTRQPEPKSSSEGVFDIGRQPCGNRNASHVAITQFQRHHNRARADRLLARGYEKAGREGLAYVIFDVAKDLRRLFGEAFTARAHVVLLFVAFGMSIPHVRVSVGHGRPAVNQNLLKHQPHQLGA